MIDPLCCFSQVASDYTATSMVGPLATVSQQTNADLITALYHFWSPLSRVMASYPANIQELLRSSIAVRSGPVDLSYGISC